MQGEHGLQRLHWRQMVGTLLKYPVKCTCSYPEFLAIVPAPKVADFIVTRGAFSVSIAFAKGCLFPGSFSRPATLKICLQAHPSAGLHIVDLNMQAPFEYSRYCQSIDYA